MRGGTHLQSGVVPRTDYTYPSTKLTAMEQLLLPHLPLRNNGSWSACNDYALHTLIQNLKIICNRKWVAAIWTVHQKPLTQPKGEGCSEWICATKRCYDVYFSVRLCVRDGVGELWKQGNKPRGAMHGMKPYGVDWPRDRLKYFYINLIYVATVCFFLFRDAARIFSCCSLLIARSITQTCTPGTTRAWTPSKMHVQRGVIDVYFHTFA